MRFYEKKKSSHRHVTFSVKLHQISYQIKYFRSIFTTEAIYMCHPVVQQTELKKLSDFLLLGICQYKRYIIIDIRHFTFFSQVLVQKLRLITNLVLYACFDFFLNLLHDSCKTRSTVESQVIT